MELTLQKVSISVIVYRFVEQETRAFKSKGLYVPQLLELLTNSCTISVDEADTTVCRCTQVRMWDPLAADDECMCTCNTVNTPQWCTVSQVVVHLHW